MTTRLLIVEDDARYRTSLRSLLDRSGLVVEAAFGNPYAALEWCRTRPKPPCDLALLDIGLPRMSGIETTRLLKRDFPECQVIALTVFEDPKTILDAICAGADGYLLKKTPARELVEQLRTIGAGGAPMSAGVARSVLGLMRTLGGSSTPKASRLNLTEREHDVLRGLVAGMTYKQVAAQLGISLDTVRTHVRALYGKLQVHGVAAAVAKALRDGLV